MGKTGPILIISMTLAVAIMAGRDLTAEEFLGFEIESGPENYVVLRDVNVRARPETKSKRIKGLKKGNIIQSVGSYISWVAVIEDGKPVGFTFDKFLLPLIDGSLNKDIVGNIKVSNRFDCNYTIAFSGKSEAGNELYKMADYEVTTECKVDDFDLTFTMYMFMTEGPAKRARPNVHQISIDVIQFEYMDDYDEIFTTTAYYDHKKDQLSYDSASLSGLVSPPEKINQDASSVADALSKTVDLTLSSWKPAVWQELAKVLNTSF